MDREINNTDTSGEDIIIAKAFQAGEKSAFDKLVLKYQHKVFNLCYRFLGDYAEANDYAQETFIKVYRSLNKFKFQSSFSTWLYRITVNTCKNRLKSAEYRYRRKMVRLDNPKESENGTYSIEMGDESLSPAAELEKKEKRRLIQQAIDSLPEEQKTVIVLRHIEDLSYEEIAKITGYNLGTVKSKLARARQKLKERLKGLV